jgi:hypothetical protein
LLLCKHGALKGLQLQLLVSKPKYLLLHCSRALESTGPSLALSLGGLLHERLSPGGRLLKRLLALSDTVNAAGSALVDKPILAQRRGRLGGCNRNLLRKAALRILEFSFLFRWLHLRL